MFQSCYEKRPTGVTYGIRRNSREKGETKGRRFTSSERKRERETLVIKIRERERERERDSGTGTPRGGVNQRTHGC